MNKHKKDQAKQLKLVIVILATSLALLVLLFFIVFSERDRFNFLYDQAAQDSLDSSYQSSRIKFCYDNEVRPCTDDNITNWNNLHPDDQFGVSPPKIR